MSIFKSCVKVQYGSIYSQSGCIIEHPALIIDEASGTLLSWGEYEKINAKYETMTAAYAKNGIPNDIVMISMDDSGLSKEEQCYIIRRCIEYTASGFQKRLCQEVKSGKDPKAWLQAEMARVPIDVTE